MIIETHVHISDSKYDADREEVLKRAEAAGVKKFINIGAETAETGKVATYDRPGVYKALGLHPHYAHEADESLYSGIMACAKSGKNVAAIGEIGLDYFKSTTPKETQERVFRKLLGMAKDLGLPVIIHSRDAHEDTLNILKEFRPEKKGVIHCFSSDADTGKKFIDEGYLLGIGGVVTFPNAAGLRQAVAQLPLNSMVLETDAPWLAPQSVRGKRNEPEFLKYVITAVAGIKGVSEKQVEEITSRNAERVFGI
jgi:TatD DNase family protein